MYLNYELYDVFTSEAFSGNPLAIFREPVNIDSNAMTSIAKELNLSETVFVLPPSDGGDHRLRIFTPNVELPFAGHPTIGTAIAIHAADPHRKTLALETNAGLVTIEYRSQSAFLTAPVMPQKIDPPIDSAAAVKLLGLDSRDVLGVQAADGGVPFTLIELANRNALSECVLSLPVWRNQLMHTAAPHVYVFCRPDEPTVLNARMFAPAMGIEEDPATGGAAVAIAATLAPGDYQIIQGVDMGRPSEISLSIGETIEIGGSAVKVGEGSMLPGRG